MQVCGDSNVTCKWVNGEFAQGTKFKDTIGNLKILHSNIDKFVKHIHREVGRHVVGQKL